MSEQTRAQDTQKTLDEIYDAAIRWISADADYPDTPPESWQAAFTRTNACVNACKGISTYALEGGEKPTIAQVEGARGIASRMGLRFMAMAKQRDGLLAALHLIADAKEINGGTIVCDFCTLQNVARAAINEVKPIGVHTTYEVQRMWINQPSRSQPLHHLHGTNVLAVREDDTTYRIYFLSGNVISQQASPLSLSPGWRESAQPQS